MNATRDWIIVGLVLLPILKDASWLIALAVSAFLYWGWGDVAVVPLIVYAVTHAGGWYQHLAERAELRRRELARIKDQRRQEKLQKEERDRRDEADRLRKTEEQQQIAALPKPVPKTEQMKKEMDDAEEMLRAIKDSLNAKAKVGNLDERTLKGAIVEAELAYRKEVKRIVAKYAKT